MPRGQTPDPDVHAQARSVLACAFPDAPPPDDSTVEGVVQALYRQHGPELARAGFPERPAAARDAGPSAQPLAAADPGARYALYIAHAAHHRVRSMTSASLGSRSNVPFQSEFVGHLPMVRVPLPPSFRVGANPNIRTQIGDVYLSSDHLVGSVELVTRKYGSQLGYTPARVELLTPARTGPTRSRFGAIATYLGYRTAGDAQPSFYLLEAGLATGEVKMLYFGATIDGAVAQRSGYQPTAYSSPNNFYRGSLTVRDNQPVCLTVQSGPPGASSYIQVSVSYQRVTAVSNDPFDLLLDAAKRVALIGQTMGQPSGVPLQELMASLARNLPWTVMPAYGGAGVARDAPAREDA